MTWYVYYSKIFVVDCIKMNFRRSFDLTRVIMAVGNGCKGSDGEDDEDLK